MRQIRAWGNTIEVRLTDLLSLWANACKAGGDPDIGFHDLDRTLDQIKRQLDREVHIPISIIESALWAANLLNEKGEFEHPDGIGFNELVHRIAKDKFSFDYFWNTLEAKKKEPKDV